MKLKTFRKVFLTGAMFFAATVAWGASGELSGTVGGTTLDGGGGTHATYGGGAAIKIGGHAHLFAEFGWSQLASEAFQTTSGGVTVNGKVGVNLANFGGGIDYGFGTSKKAVPYVVAAVGAGHFYANGSGTGSNGNSASVSLTVTNAAYVGLGGGVRFFLGNNWGFKPEVRFQRYANSGFAGNTAVYTAGLFWDFGK